MASHTAITVLHQLHDSHRLPMRNVLIIVALLALAMLLAWAIPPIPASRGIASYLPLHTLLETIAIIISALVFTVGWNASVGKLAGNVMLLACAFTGVGLLDFSHVLSYTGMPVFVTESSPAKSISFWLAARALAASVLFAVAVTPWRPLVSTKTRYVLLGAILGLTAAIYWLFLFHGEMLPPTFIPGKGLTAFKVGAEYSIIGLNIITAVALWIRMAKPQPFNAAALFGAVCVMALSEFFFTLYASVTDIFNLLGHIYKVISYLFIYRAIFVAAIENPYLRLSASQNQLQATLDALPDLLFEIGQDGQYYSYHSPLSGNTASSGADLTGKTLAETMPPGVESTIKNALQIADRSGRASGEYELATVQGKHCYEFSVVRKPVAPGQPARFIVLSRDVSARKQIEETNNRLAERLELATSSANIGIWDWDIVNNTIMWDDRMFKLYGLKRENFGGVYEAWLSALHPEDRAEAEEAIQQTLHGEKNCNIEFRIQLAQGGIRHLKAMGDIVRGTKGEPLRMIGVNYDITERKQAGESLKKLNQELELRVEQRTAEMTSARDEAERASAAKTEFLSRMSHELRTPLNAILGFGQLLEIDPKHPLNQQQAENVREILHAGNHLLELVNEVLDLSRIESGRLELSFEAVAVAPLLDACVAQLRPLAAARQIGIMLPQNLNFTLLADRLRLREVLFNLLSNAVKYNRAGGEIHITCAPAAQQRLRISVRDSGRGISADSIPRLFQPFERLESAYDGIGGTGIGLALAKKLVLAMHGEIGVESVPEAGSTFWFELPLAAASSLAPAAPALASAGARTLLYIEDNPANLKLVRRLMAARKDVTLLDAASAEEGLHIAASRLPDMILLDIQLPGMDGFEALRRLRDNPLTRNIPVIALSANAMTHNIERGKAAGFDDYLTKPLDIARFYTLTDTYLGAFPPQYSQ